MKIKKFGTPLKRSAVKLMMLGSGELGKEVVIEAMRFGIDVIACDRYADAPAMLVANSTYVFDMRDGGAMRHVVETVKPDFIVPEIEAIATDTLVELEKEGWTVIPTARAAQLTMDRRGIRKLAAEKLKLPTSPYRFAASLEELQAGAEAVGFPCFIKGSEIGFSFFKGIFSHGKDSCFFRQLALKGLTTTHCFLYNMFGTCLRCSTIFYFKCQECTFFNESGFFRILVIAMTADYEY